MTSHASKPGSSIRAAAGSLPAHRDPPPNDDEPTHVGKLISGVKAGSTSGRIELPQQSTDGPLPPTPPDDKTVISKRPPTMDAPLPGLATTQHLGKTLIGKKLEHYELVEFVGGGGMGAVFRANDTRLGRTVAVKVLSRDQTDDETIRRFRNEAQSAARLDHPNIARVHYVGEENGWNYIVFEFIEGTNLRDVVEDNGPLPLEEALSYTLQVSEALQHASSRDVVHRDIKPSNVLLMESGQVKLVDMGLARLHQVQSSSDDLTASGVTLGTFDYISPEQARDPRVADVRSDIYSLGCTLYYMLVGQPPFPDGTALQKLLRHNADEPPDVRIFRPELSTKVSALIARMLAKRPAQRFQTPAELIHEILLVAEQAGLSSITRRGQDWVSPPAAEPSLWARTLPILAPVVVLIAAVILVDAYLPAGSQMADVSLRPKFPDAPVVAQPETPVDTGPEAGPMLPRRASDGATERPIPSTETAAATTPADTAVNPPLETTPDVSTNSAEASIRAASPQQSIAISAEPTGASVGASADSAAVNPAAIGEGTSLIVAPPAAASEASPVKITKIIVAPGAESQAGADFETASSLAAACKRAAELGVAEIELQFDGELLEQPLDVGPSKLTTVRAAPGMKPSIVFRPESAGLAANRQMIRSPATGMSRLRFEGISFRLDLPPDSASGWALFSLNPQQVLELSECVLTVCDYGQFGAPIHSQVGMIVVQSRRAGDAMMLDEEIAMAQPATINLDRTIARGQAALVTMPDETSLDIVWNQGLLVSTQHLIETGGTAMKPKYYNRIDIDLTRVTMIAQQGLYQMKRRSGAAYQLDLDVQSTNSILSPAVGEALFEYIGIAAIDEVKLKFGGEDNCYPREDLAWLRAQPAGATEMDFDLDNRGRWSMERRPGPAVAWQSPPPADLPAHQRTKQHYLVSEETMSDAGFNPELLPDIAGPAAAPSSAPPVPPQQPGSAPPDGGENADAAPLVP